MKYLTLGIVLLGHLQSHAATSSCVSVITTLQGKKPIFSCDGNQTETLSQIDNKSFLTNITMVHQYFFAKGYKLNTCDYEANSYANVMCTYIK